ncbi:LysR family transcriptional regulator [Tatumella sp. TA1]|uniref:LysR family transcriptional regulator n=1 Tax=Rosenbergiella collisarenosi TaxID=1544695 RepID=UPI0008F81622|nr:LysR family transcriptional regulator [Rosenbergiella collisarenosi]MBT0719905.1 LysR family transcriptional regulator [Rosenbergiella collisarenosi]QGX90520.1 LysR family transcriptional regulator [Tatumella sp. TA1]
MLRENFTDLTYLIVVAREQSFTRAAARLGVSQSALSHAIRSLEERLNMRLLTRTTRSVSTTEAGEQLVNTITPLIDDLESVLQSLNDEQGKIVGNLRITAGEHALRTTLLPKVYAFIAQYPEVNIEFVSDNSLTNIVSERFDAGVRLGDQIEKDMIAIRIGPDWRMTAVAAPSYFAKWGKPDTPYALQQHNCINMRLPTLGGLYQWEFIYQGKEIRVRVEGQLTFNHLSSRIDAAVAGLGIIYVPEESVAEQVAQGRLEPVLEEWCPYFTGYHLYYPSRKQHTAAFAKFIEAVRD